MRLGKFFAGFVIMIEIFLQYWFKKNGWGIGNSGISFGMFKNIPLSLLAVFMVVLLVIIKDEKKQIWWQLVLLGGGTNLLSRFFWGGFVWDYIPVMNLWFNGADLMMSMGILVMLYENRNLVGR